MINLLHIIESLSPYGGTPRKLFTLAKHQNSLHCRHIFLCYLPSSMKDEFKRYGAVVKCMDNTSIAKITSRAVRFAKNYNADVICTHFTRPLMVGYLAAKINGLPIIHNEHSSAHYRRGFGRYLAKIILPRVNNITCNSRYTLDSVRKEYGLPLEKMVFIHNPVEERKCVASRNNVRRTLGLTNDELVIGHVGGMIPQRDQITLIKAFSLLKKIYPNSHLIMIGSGSLNGELQSIALSLNLKTSVVFVGYSDKVGEYLNAMDIYVNPTLDEGFGIAVVEAMLARLPVVLSDRGAHPELIENGISGMLYSGGDSISLTKVLCGLVVDSTRRVNMGEAARTRALLKFNPKRYAEAYFTNAQTIIKKFKMSQMSMGRRV